jgi:molybdopterin synthase catalytic subunit
MQQIGAPATVTVTALFFARLRELAGARQLEVQVRPGDRARDVWAAAARACPRLGDPDSPPRDCRVAIDERYAAWDDAVTEGATVAFIPPVAGGAEAEVAHRVLVRISDARLDARELETFVRSDFDGAVCTFSGVVRDHNEGRAVEQLEYEAYAAMAEAEMRRIAEEVLARCGIRALAMAHRVGTLEIGEVSVVVSAAAAHRAEAFEGCRLAIDLLKARVPIWKREHHSDGARWVGGDGTSSREEG